MSDYRSVRTAAGKLSVADRLRLIDELVASIPDDQPSSVSEEWTQEIGRRSEQIDNGAVATEPWSEIRKRLRDRVGLDDAS